MRIKGRSIECPISNVEPAGRQAGFEYSFEVSDIRVLLT